MIKNKIKSARGISLITLTVTIAVLMIVTNIIIYNVKDNLKLGNLKEMQNDIANLREKVSSFYAQNGKIPAKIKYQNIEHIRSAGLISSAVDTGEFYVIDLTALENLTLNQGKDFEKIKNLEQLTEEQAKNNTDLYIINEASHNIFYVKGVTIDNETFYTDYRAEEVDKVAPELRYVDNIKIPDGFYYAGGTKEIGILIRNADNTETYKWIPVEEEITELPENIEIQNEEKADFIKSVNLYKGYYKSTTNNKVKYFILEKWSPIYDTKGLYKDKNGDTAYIPQGFQVSEMIGQNTIDGGLVIRDSEKNEFVWVPVPNMDNFHTIEDYYNNELDNMLSNCHEPSQEGYRYSTEQAEYDAMKNSVKDNGGFYIGRYEAGNDGSDNVIVQKNATVYNNIKWGTSMADITGGAVEKAKKFTDRKPYSGKVTSTLVYGVQWDATMQFIDSNYITGTCDENSYVRNSTGKGHYNESSLIKTGSNENYAVKNIYDMAGNVLEWTMETYSTRGRVYRGGYYRNDGANFPASNRGYDSTVSYGGYIGFRLALYL